jgi:hypothetical protein
VNKNFVDFNISPSVQWLCFFLINAYISMETGQLQSQLINRSLGLLFQHVPRGGATGAYVTYLFIKLARSFSFRVYF